MTQALPAGPRRERAFRQRVGASFPGLDRPPCARQTRTRPYDDPVRRPAADPYWNTDVARHPGILRSVPEGCGDALDIGCGDGLLARKLAGRAKLVTGIDKSPEMIARARESAAGHPQLAFIEGDFLTAELPGASYDFICSVTAIHHTDFEAALVRMRELLRPGGTLVVVGLAREASVTDWAALVAAAPIVRITKVLRRATGPQGMPVADPQMSYGQVRAAARCALPPACAAPLLTDVGEARLTRRRRGASRAIADVRPEPAAGTAVAACGVRRSSPQARRSPPLSATRSRLAGTGRSACPPGARPTAAARQPGRRSPQRLCRWTPPHRRAAPPRTAG